MGEAQIFAFCFSFLVFTARKAEKTEPFMVRIIK